MEVEYKSFAFYKSSESTPKPRTPILIKYKKGSKAYYWSKKGTFLTEGYIEIHKDNVIWNNYAGQLLTAIGPNWSGKSKNEIISWAYIDNEGI